LSPHTLSVGNGISLKYRREAMLYLFY